MKNLARHAITPIMLLCQFDEHSDDEATDLVIPEGDALAEMSEDDLAALLDQAQTAFDALYDRDDLSADDLSAMNDLAAGIEAIRGENERRETERAEARAAADEMRARVHGADETDGADASTQGDDGETDDNADGEDGDGEGDGEDGDGEGTDGEDGEGDDDAEPGAADGVTAGASRAATRRRTRVRVPVSALSRHAPQPSVDDRSGSLVTITAAADLRGVTPGTSMEPLALAQALHDRARHLGEGHSAPVASISVPSTGLIAAGMDREAQEAEIARITTLPGDGSADALVAAGGWCAPSETFYDLFSIEGRDGLVDVPTATVTRGGMEYVENGGPSLADATGIPFLWTEAMDVTALDPEDEAFAAKPCFRVPCPEWVEERLDAHGICLTHGNLADRAYPEMTRRFVDLTLAAHVHLINSRVLASMVADSISETFPSIAFSATSQVLDAVEWNVVDYRDKYRMPLNATLEAVFPHWLRPLMRADLGRRNGVDPSDGLGATDAQLQAWLMQRGVRPQWVYDWQSLRTIAPLAALGGGRISAPVPATVKFLVYAAGTFVRGNGGSLDLGVTRDSTLNPTNDHTVLFTEDFLLVAKRGHESRVVNVAIDADGETGGQVVAD